MTANTEDILLVELDCHYHFAAMSQMGVFLPREIFLVLVYSP